MRSGIHASNQDTTSVDAMKMAIQLLFRSEEDVDESLEWGEPLNLVRAIVSRSNPQQLPPILPLSTLPPDDIHELHNLYVLNYASNAAGRLSIPDSIRPHFVPQISLIIFTMDRVGDDPPP